MLETHTYIYICIYTQRVHIYIYIYDDQAQSASTEDASVEALCHHFLDVIYSYIHRIFKDIYIYIYLCLFLYVYIYISYIYFCGLYNIMYLKDLYIVYTLFIVYIYRTCIYR